MQSRWIIAPPEQLNGGPILWSEICDSECIARILLRKGFATSEEVQGFLRPRLKLLTDPFLLPNMEVAVGRILAALDRKERIVLFGDYDVDGVTSLTLLAEVLQGFGAVPGLFLPLRMEEGYGLSPESVDRCLEQHRPDLLITVDCGTSSLNEIAELKKRGVDVIVLDHHEPKSSLPDCVAVVNPKIDPNSAFDYLCSVGITFKLCHALLKRRPVDIDLKSKLELVALGTVADLVPLHAENRTLVQRGAVELSKSTRPGLKKLMQLSGVIGPVLAEDIAYRLGPRLNAAGRLTTAEKALRLLLTQEANEAAELAQFLDKQNRERQEVERQIVSAAEARLAKDFVAARDAGIVLAERDWHPGVLGIVASRIARKYHRPTIIIGLDANGIGKGSGRSIMGFNLVEALAGCETHLDKFGGHEMAAGITIREESVDSFSTAFREIARAILTDDDLQPRLSLDHELNFSELNLEFLKWHELLQPFGNGNLQPCFISRSVELAAPPKSVNDKHLILRLRQGNYHRRAVYFDGASEPLPAAPWDVAFRVRANNYEGETLLDLHIAAIREAASA